MFDCYVSVARSLCFAFDSLARFTSVSRAIFVSFECFVSVACSVCIVFDCYVGSARFQYHPWLCSTLYDLCWHINVAHFMNHV